MSDIQTLIVAYRALAHATEISSRIYQLGSGPTQPQAEGNNDIEDSENEDDWFGSSKMHFLDFLFCSDLILVRLVSRAGVVRLILL